ncbi:MAG TPA: hypothetical protein VEW74_01750 [Candidatus Nitrosotalea sp.]|nr:hypothetical protein [Candidatus Nitrosotalea sp.]
MESRTRRRLSGLAAAIVAIVAVGAARASVGTAEQTGVFALADGRAKIVSKFWAVPGSGLSATLKVRQFAPNGTRPILDYSIEQERTMHMIVVRDDFATFAHLHPAFDVTTGTFSQAFTKEANHRYYVYADTKPRSVGQQVFRFTIESDGPAASPRPGLEASAPAATAGPYTVTLSQTTLTANAPNMVKLTISQNGKPAKGLGTYLGAAAHAVFISTANLTYVHVHPKVAGKQSMDSDMMDMEDMGSEAGPLLQMKVPALPLGSYKLWLQFRGANDRVYTVPFTLVAR